MDISFEGKRALVTGAAGCFGKAITEILIKCGATVIAVDVRGDELQAVYKDCPRVIPVACDLTQWEATKAMVTNHLPIDLLCNNAGRTIPKPFHEYDNDTIDKIYEINVKAVINVSQVVIKNLMERESKGVIVNTSSVVSRGGHPFVSIYASAKAAVSSLTQTMALEYGSHGIRVNAVLPGCVMTPLLQPILDATQTKEEDIISMTATGRLSTPQDIAETVVFLLSDRASNINGSEIVVDGGLSYQ